ncbi:MAG: hypothetical protein M0Z75_16000 [Nitrospiraceae bacterium]|nr:hypothetical protein [Nitrospiraceae bacterium]
MKKPAAPENGPQAAGIIQPGPQGGQKSCRCKEVAEKKPMELVKTMFDDLSFWKKKKKNTGKSSPGAPEGAKTGGKKAG